MEEAHSSIVMREHSTTVQTLATLLCQAISLSVRVRRATLQAVLARKLASSHPTVCFWDTCLVQTETPTCVVQNLHKGATTTASFLLLSKGRKSMQDAKQQLFDEVLDTLEQERQRADENLKRLVLVAAHLRALLPERRRRARRGRCTPRR
jgi:hypothetical protein